MKATFCVIAAGAVVLRASLCAAGPSPPVDFDRQVRPILAKNCFICHGPDEKHREAGLRLDIREGATRSLDDGKRAIVPGSLKNSELIQRITTLDKDERMPPGRANRSLAPAQIELLTRWVKRGRGTTSTGRSKSSSARHCRA